MARAVHAGSNPSCLENYRCGGSRRGIVSYDTRAQLHSRDTLWVVADRRLSYSGRLAPKDDAVKLTILETADGRGVLAYAGLGATALGTQPSEWMSAVLRGRGGLSFEQSLEVLAAAATRELPKHLSAMPDTLHSILIPAFIRGVGSRLYSINHQIDRATGQHRYGNVFHQRSLEPGAPSITLIAAGTGGAYLHRTDKSLARSLHHLVKANDRGKISDYAVADQLARISYRAYKGVGDGTVGPRSIVVWRRRLDVRRDCAGGGHQYYTGTTRDDASPPLPEISWGVQIWVPSPACLWQTW